MVSGVLEGMTYEPKILIGALIPDPDGPGYVGWLGESEDDPWRYRFGAAWENGKIRIFPVEQAYACTGELTTGADGRWHGEMRDKWGFSRLLTGVLDRVARRMALSGAMGPIPEAYLIPGLDTETPETA